MGTINAPHTQALYLKHNHGTRHLEYADHTGCFSPPGLEPLTFKRKCPTKTDPYTDKKDPPKELSLEWISLTILGTV